MLDHIWRWDAMGGDLLMVQLPTHRKCTDGPGGEAAVLLLCVCVRVCGLAGGGAPTGGAPTIPYCYGDRAA